MSPWNRGVVTAVVTIVVMMVVIVPPVSPCSCELKHPQKHVCDSDFVVFARVRRLTTTPNGNYAYKVKVKRLAKGSEKVESMLQKGLIYTPKGTCEANLRNRTSYVITGSVAANKPWVNLCNFAAPMRSLTPKMKKGFKLLYKSGCDCSIMSCHHWEQCPKTNFYCSWETVREEDDCQGRQSVCLRGPGGSCDWLRGRLYTRCMKTRQRTTASRNNTTLATPNNTHGRPPKRITSINPSRRPGTRITSINANRRPGIRITPNNANRNPVLHNSHENNLDANDANDNTQDNNISRGPAGYPRRRKQGRFWYKRRLGGRRRLRRPLRNRQRRPSLGYQPKTV